MKGSTLRATEVFRCWRGDTKSVESTIENFGTESCGETKREKIRSYGFAPARLICSFITYYLSYKEFCPTLDRYSFGFQMLHHLYLHSSLVVSFFSHYIITFFPGRPPFFGWPLWLLATETAALSHIYLISICFLCLLAKRVNDPIYYLQVISHCNCFA